MLRVLDYHEQADPSRWLGRIAQSGWRAGEYLCRLLETGRFHAVLGEKSRLLLLTEGDEPVSFCTYAQRDEIPSDELTPWAGFVFTFPQHRGKRRMGKLLEHVYRLAKADGFPCVYISTDREGLYEKYGCTWWKTMQNTRGEACRIYRLPIRTADFGAVLGRQVCGTVDRPLGSAHPDHPEMIYPINYGYADGIFAGDGEEQDVYILGADRPLQTFAGRVIAVLHRLNDNEDKWIVSLDGKDRSDEEILEAVSFQEQYYMGELYR